MRIASAVVVIVVFVVVFVVRVVFVVGVLVGVVFVVRVFVVMVIAHVADRDRLGHLDDGGSPVGDGRQEVDEPLLERQPVRYHQVGLLEGGAVGERGLERVRIGARWDHRCDLTAAERAARDIGPDSGGSHDVHVRLGR